MYPLAYTNLNAEMGYTPYAIVRVADISVQDADRSGVPTLRQALQHALQGPYPTLAITDQWSD